MRSTRGFDEEDHSGLKPRLRESLNPQAEAWGLVIGLLFGITIMTYQPRVSTRGWRTCCPIGRYNNDIPIPGFNPGLKNSKKISGFSPEQENFRASTRTTSV